MHDADEEFRRSGIQDKALCSKPLVQPFLDRANADPLGDHSGIIADMRAAVIPFLKKHNPNLQ